MDALLARPGLLRVGVVLVALLLIGGVLRWQQAQTVRLEAAQTQVSQPTAARALEDAASAASAGAGENGASEVAPLPLVTAYTAASITAAQTGQVGLLAPYLVPDSALWARIAGEYARRAAAGETHQPTLVRWGLVGQTATATDATVELQEQWNDVRVRAGETAVTRTGIVQRVRYALQRPAATDRWQIAAIEVQVILPGTTR